MRLVAAAQVSGSRAQALADRAAALLFYVALAADTVTLIYWWLAGDKGHAFYPHRHGSHHRLPARYRLGHSAPGCPLPPAGRAERPPAQRQAPPPTRCARWAWTAST